VADPSLSISPARVVGVGVTGGLLSGFFGVGGGIVMVPLLIWLLRVDRHTAHATSLAAIFVIAVSGGLTYGLAGSVDLGLGLALGAGGVAGAYAGAQLMHRLSTSALRIAFAVVLLAAGIRMVLP
jgi:uncharacterized protein